MSPCNHNDDSSISDNNTSVEDAEVSMDDNMQNDFPTNNEQMGYTPLVDIDVSNNYQPIMFSTGDDESSEEEEEEVVDSISLANDALRSLDDEYQSVVRRTVLPSTIDHPALATNNHDIASGYNDIGEAVRENDTTEELKTDEGTKEVEKKIEEVKVDSNAVLKAIESIRLRSPKLTQNLDLNSQNITLPIPNRVETNHPIIPSLPLAAFHRTTSKAIQATHNLSRSASIAECVLRLNLLTKKSLMIHVIGVDDIRECTGVESIQKAFSPFVRWMSGVDSCFINDIDIILIGPTIVTNLNQKVISLFSPDNTAGSSLKKANATCVKEYYHDYLQQNGNTSPDIIIFFNPGLWGYQSWQPTLQHLADHFTNVPLVITSYTLKEADEDYDIMESFIQKKQNSSNDALSSHIIWDIEVNPFHSKRRRDNVTTAPGNADYFDNFAWQCWKF